MRNLARFSFRHPKRILLIAGLLAVAGGASVLTLQTEQDLARLLPQDLPSIGAFDAMRGVFDSESDLYALMEGGDTQALLDASDEFVKRLRANPVVAGAHNRFTADERRFFFDLLPRHLFLTLPEKDLSGLLSFLQDPAALRRHMELNLRQLHSAAPALKERIQRDPLNLEERSKTLLRIAEAGGKISITEDGYFLSEDGRAVLVQIRGLRPAQDLAYARRLITAVRKDAGSPIRLAGGYAEIVQDAAMIRDDMILSTTTSFVAILILFWIVFRSFRSMIPVALPLLVALFWTIGWIAVLFGRLNPLLAGSAAIIAGLGIDFTIHLITRFRHELHLGADPESAVAASVDRVGRGIAIAAASTTAVFFSFLISVFPGMREFGVVTGVGILLCLLSTLTVLPALLALLGTRPAAMPPAMAPPMRRAKLILILSIVILGGAFWLGSITFEPDWKNLRPKNDPALDTRRRVGELFWGSGENLFLLVKGDPIEKFARLQPALSDLRDRGVLVSYRTVTSVVPPLDRQKANRRTLESLDVDAVLQGVRTAMDEAGFRVEVFSDYLKELGEDLRRKEPIDAAFLEKNKLESLFSPYIAGEMGVAQLFPGPSLWERDERRRLIENVRGALDPIGVKYELTGFKIVTDELESVLTEDFARLLWLASGLIVVLMLVMFRDPRLVLLALLPLTGGVVLLSAVMWLCGWHVNIMNLVVFPMILGIGIDDGVHLVHAYRDSAKERFDSMVPVTLRAILLTTITTVLGFGSLALTENRGVASMGLVAGVGMICCLIPSFWTLPAALHLLNRRR